MNSFARRLAALAGAAALSAGLAAPAHAEQWARTDARGDVTSSTNCDAEGSSCTDTIDAAAKQPDVLRVVTTHTTDRVKVYARYAEMTSGGLRVHQFRVYTNEGVRRRLTVVLDDGRVVYNQLDRDSGSKVACAGLRRSIDYGANTVALSIPRSCLSNPRWVRVGFGSMIIRDVNDATRGYKSDDALRSGLSASTSDLVLGPRLSRG